MRLIAVEGIGETYAGALESAGVSTVEQLLDAAGSPEGRRELAQRTGVSPQRVLEWVNRADLMRINGVGSEFSDLLEASGVDTVGELATHRADNLAAMLQEVNAAKKLVRRTPSVAEVEKWIAAAKTLPAKVATASKEHGSPKGQGLPGTRWQSESLVVERMLAELESAGQDPNESVAANTQFAFRRAILDLISEAAATFGGLAEALAWLKSPNRSIGNATPESLLDKGPDGVAEARAILFKLEEGMFS